jgi:hypothetical protein
MAARNLSLLITARHRCHGCRSCNEDEHFERVFQQLHGAEEQHYYNGGDERSPTGSSWTAIMDAARYPFGTPRFSNPRSKPKKPHA